jgi:prepilin-type N-terminal cleavage/methylation domain-containing protein
MTDAAAGTRRASHAQRREAMTLVEVLVVVVIIAMVATGITFAIGGITRSNLRKASMRVVSSARYAYSRAAARGTTVRVLLDFDNNRISIEEAHGRIFLARTDDARREEVEEQGEDGAAVDPWAAASARLSDTMRPSFGSSPFEPIRGVEGEVLTTYTPRSIGSGIRFLKLIAPHEPQPRERGQGAVYFFPGGMSEHAVVQLADSGDRVYSVEIHPLTGRGKVHTTAFEPEPLSEDEQNVQQSELEED